IPQPVDDALGRGVGVEPALVGDDLRAAREAAWQHALDAVIQVSIVAGEGRVAACSHLGGRYRGFGHGFEAEIIEIAFVGVEDRGLDPDVPPCGAGADADYFVRHPGLFNMSSTSVEN